MGGRPSVAGKGDRLPHEGLLGLPRPCDGEKPDVYLRL